MKRVPIPKLTYANVMATIAVFIALGGASYAAIQVPRNSVGSAQLKPRSVGAQELKPNAVTSAKIRKGSLRPAHFATGPSTPRRSGTCPKGMEFSGYNSCISKEPIGGYAPESRIPNVVMTWEEAYNACFVRKAHLPSYIESYLIVQSQGSYWLSFFTGQRNGDIVAAWLGTSKEFTDSNINEDPPPTFGVWCATKATNAG